MVVSTAPAAGTGSTKAADSSICATSGICFQHRRGVGQRRRVEGLFAGPRIVDDVFDRFGRGLRQRCLGEFLVVGTFAGFELHRQLGNVRVVFAGLIDRAADAEQNEQVYDGGDGEARC